MVSNVLLHSEFVCLRHDFRYDKFSSLMNAHVEAFLSTFISVGDNDVLLVQLSIKYHQFSLIKKSRPTVDL